MNPDESVQQYVGKVEAELDRLDNGTRERNGHLLALAECDWRCRRCGHAFDAAADADLFKCGESCAGKHPGDIQHRAGGAV